MMKIARSGLRLVLVLGLLLFSLALVSMNGKAFGAVTGTIYSWGDPLKGGPACRFSGCEYSPQPLNAIGNPVMALDAGNDFNLALMADGYVRSWGENDFGQLGIGNTSPDLSDPAYIPKLSNVIATATGNHDAMALLSNGEVVTWGNNDHGQLGDGTFANSSTPQLVAGLSNIIAVAAAADHDFALTSTGNVWAWGGNDDGELGLGHISGPVPVPTMIPNLSGVIAISTGPTFGDALLSTHVVETWGSNLHGQLGDGTFNNHYAPARVVGLSGVAQISAGGNNEDDGHQLAIVSNGTVMAWGANTFGQVGNGTTADADAPVRVAGLTKVSFVAAGGYHSMALSHGELYAWGGNDFGQLGDGTTTNRVLPEAIMSANLIAAGSLHGIALG
jgi:alpha-tubulin suppressor-like RCC1 family protein